jgi:hypothetical protein
VRPVIFFDGRQLRLVAGSGLTAHGLQEAFRRALAAIRVRDGLRVLLDLRALDRLELGEAELHALGFIADQAGLPGVAARVAWVARHDLVFGLGCMFRGSAALLPLEVEVFRTLEEAECWLRAPGSFDTPTPSAPSSGLD